MAKALEFEAKVSADEFNSLLRQFQAGGEGAARAINDALGGTVKKTLLIETQTDISGARQLVAVEKERLSVADAIERQLKSLQKTEAGSVTSLRQQVNEAKQARDGIAKYQSGVNALGGEVTKVNDRWIAQNQKVQQLQRQLDLAGASGFWDRAKAGLNIGGLINFSNGLTQITNGLQSASIIIGQVVGSFNTLFSTLSRLQQFELTFKAIGASAGETRFAFEESTRIALGLGVGIDTVRDAFQQLTPVVLAIGGSINDVSQITEALSSRFVAFGLNADKSRRVLNGVIQAFGKGRLQAEELTQQISEADPAFRTDLARAIGVSVQELNELVKNGELTSRFLLEVIPKLSKSSFLFGKLGTSAQSATSALRESANSVRQGGDAIVVTVEQVQQQIQNLNTLNLQNLANAFKPLLFTILDVTAVITDLGTTLVNSQGFKTFAEFINSLATQFALVVKATGSFVGAIVNIVSVIAGAINTVDDFLAQFLKFKPIVNILAALITTKLVTALIALTIKGVAGLAIFGIKALGVATASFASGGIGGLSRALLGSLASFAGFKKATLDQIKTDLAAVASTRARIQALNQLKVAQAGGGLVAGFGPAALEAAGRRAAIKQAEQQARANSRAAISNAAVGATAATAGSQLTGMGAAAAGAGARVGLLARLGGFLLNPWVAVGVTVALAAASFIDFGGSASKVTPVLDQFQEGLQGIKQRSQQNIEALKGGADSSENFRQRLEDLQKTSEKEFKIDLGITGFEAAKETAQIFKDTKSAVAEAQNAVKGYSAGLDESGTKGQIASQKILDAESANQLALDLTKQKRDEAFAAATKGGQKISEDNAKQLSSYQNVIEKLEQQREEIKKIKGEASDKGIKIEVNVANQAKEAIEGIKSQTESLQAQLLLEVDPNKFAELQSKLNGLESRLAFLKADRVQLQIDLKFEIDKASLEAARNIAQAETEALRTRSELVSATFGIETSILNRREEVANKELDKLREVEASKEKIEQKEKEIERIQEKKRQVEAQSIQAQLNALPFINASELKSLEIGQQLAELEAEKLDSANKRAIAELRIQKTQLAAQAERFDGKDDDRAQSLRAQAILAQQQIELIEKEQASLSNSAAARKELNALQVESLRNQQESKRLGLESQLIELTGLSKIAKESSGNLRLLNSENEKTVKTSEQAASAAKELRSALSGDIGGFSQELGSAANEAGNLENSTTGFLRQLILGRDAAEGISAALDKAAIDRSAGFVVRYAPARWAGGPTQAGQVYQVNELGREGFLSAAGTLQSINKPKNSLWRAPSSGTVVPAHIMQALRNPKSGIDISQAIPSVHQGGSSMRRLSRVLQLAFARNQNPQGSMSELASIQAHQAKQIGKLSRAVSDLANKDWNVNVGLRVKDNATYLSALNHRL